MYIFLKKNFIMYIFSKKKKNFIMYLLKFYFWPPILEILVVRPPILIKLYGKKEKRVERECQRLNSEKIRKTKLRRYAGHACMNMYVRRSNVITDQDGVRKSACVQCTCRSVSNAMLL